MKSLGGEGDAVKKRVVTAKDALRYAMSLPVAVTVSGIDSMQACFARTSASRAASGRWARVEMAALRDRAALDAADRRPLRAVQDDRQARSRRRPEAARLPAPGRARRLTQRRQGWPDVGATSRILSGRCDCLNSVDAHPLPCIPLPRRPALRRPRPGPTPSSASSAAAACRACSSPTERTLERRVVVKVLPAELAARRLGRTFKREILLSARLQHPHIVRVLSAGDADGLPYFTMPFVEGESLRARLARAGRSCRRRGGRASCATSRARSRTRTSAASCIATSSRTTFCSLRGAATVTDFGVAKALSSARRVRTADAVTLHRSASSLGTPLYMAPEQAAARSRRRSSRRHLRVRHHGVRDARRHAAVRGAARRARSSPRA